MGLPSNNVYELKQDSKGFIWGTTDKGVFRYDGKTFKYFTSDNGLGIMIILQWIVILK